MKKMISLIALGAFALASVAMAMTTTTAVVETVDEAKVSATIDARLHELLLKSQIENR